MKKPTKKDSRKGEEPLEIPDDWEKPTEPPLIDLYPGTPEDADAIKEEYDRRFPDGERKK